MAEGLFKYFIDWSTEQINQLEMDQLLTFKSIVTSTITACVILIFYWLFYVPWSWKRDLTDVGYGVSTALKGHKKRDAINRLKRLRKFGDRLPPPFPNGWFRILPSDSLKPEQVLNVDCLGQNFVVFRSKDGKVFILDAYCPHLGANLGVGGKVNNDCIVCPFHEWSFRGSDGVCNNIPYSTNQCIPSSAKIKPWISCEVNEEIFVWHHAEGEEPWEIPRVKEIESGEWVLYGENEFLVNCHIQDIPENGADIAHLNVVHVSNMMNWNDLRKPYSKWREFMQHFWRASWKPPTESNRSHISTLDLEHSTRLFDKFELFGVTLYAEQVGPGIVQMHVNCPSGRIVICQTVTPVEPLVQKVTHRFYGPRYYAMFGKFAILGESIMVERDIMVWNNKTFVDNPCLVKEDKLIKSYRQWYRQFYSENSLNFAAASENLSW